MKENIIVCFIVIVAATLFVSCSPKESNYSLHLVVDSWSDQDIDYPEDEFLFENIILNETYVIALDGDSDYLLRKFKVIKIDESSITISTPIPLSVKEEGINLGSKEKKFTIEYGKATSLDTLIMDGGEWYVFSLIEKE
ncbi:hypothetical protein [Lachnoclostridium phytofermentans]|uniref:hypothetical protein n=1 Tax=Lachnoclostridium phytofermentans TaxID=66219 RepID=UPI000494EB22|nr:hypothetical protein [Lachnoclostridium phytofermentans]